MKKNSICVPYEERAPKPGHEHLWSTRVGSKLRSSLQNPRARGVEIWYRLGRSNTWGIVRIKALIGSSTAQLSSSTHRSLFFNLELHGFVDASLSAYTATAYFRVVQRDTVRFSLVSSKTKVAPPKQLSVHSLELQAAVLGTRLV